MKTEELPNRLRKFTVDQNYDRYTPIDQAVWRYILRQLKSYLETHGHKSYNEGLKKTGVSTEEIPRIENISAALEKFGWKAIPVSGFIPPAVFMEMQSLGYLPIASDMRNIEHIHYTPAPDIVHEAAGHAPIISEPEYAQYLKNYAQVSKKAIISQEDLDLYEAIRILSDLKEAPGSTPEQVREAEKNLVESKNKITHNSEASLLGRMNWWTAEYGLIGSLENPQIFGAGLLSSIGEAKDCLKKDVRKIPLSVECIGYNYDITEPQPQLFVTPDFKTLTKVLEDLKNKMSFIRGGLWGLEKAKMACSINTVELNTGLQVSGQVTDYIKENDKPVYFRMEGPCQLSYKNKQLPGHSIKYHQHGYSTPVGFIEGQNKCLSEMNKEELTQLSLTQGENINLHFTSGVEVKGQLKDSLTIEDKLFLLSFENCSVTYKDQTLFQPDWGTFDMAVGHSVPSVYGGAADEDEYHGIPEFVKKVIPLQNYTEKEQILHGIYQKIRQIRKDHQTNPVSPHTLQETLKKLLEELTIIAPEDWLARLEIYELSLQTSQPDWSEQIKSELLQIALNQPDKSILIQDGLKLSSSL